LGGATIAIIQGCIVFILAMLFGFRPNLTLLPMTFLFMLLIAVFFTGLGITIASSIEDINGFQLIMNLLVQPLFFLSGALFPLNNLPKALSIVTSIDPLSYGVDGIRGTLTGMVHFGLSTDLLILVVITAGILTLGAYLFSKIQI